MRFCVRREIDILNSDERLRKVEGVPIEIALPANLEEYLTQIEGFSGLPTRIADHGIPVYSVHAPHGHLSDPSFKSWSSGVIAFAEAVRAEMVVFHPEVVNQSRREVQLMALNNIRYLQDRTRVQIAVETFHDRDHVLMPDDIMAHELPMVLDTSLLPKTEITWIIESYRTHIVNLHLSAVTPGSIRKDVEHRHRPVESDHFCLDLLDRLHELGWSGIVTLEYMPWLADKSVDDRQLLERIYHYQ